MNRKLWITLWAATLLVTGCNNPEQNIKNQTSSTSQEIGILFSDTWEQDGENVDYYDATMVGYDETDIEEPPYRGLIQEVNSPIVSWDLFKSEIAITIDDGNGAKNIDAILDTLAKYDVKATFFIVWTRIRMHANQRRRAIDEWHQICNHTYDHHYFRNVDTVLLEQQIIDWESAVIDSLWADYLDIMKTNFPFFRFPWWCGDAKPEHLAVLKKYWYLPIWRSDDTWRSGKWLNYWEIELFHFKPQDFDRISGCIQEALEQWLQCKQMTDIVNPKEWYNSPITRDNLRSARRDVKNLKESWDDDTIINIDSLSWWAELSL